MGYVISINISAVTGVIKEPVPQALFLAGKGIDGDAHCGLSAIRQVSLLADESVDKMRGCGMELVPGVFAENITTKGIDLQKLPVGTQLAIGETIQCISQHGKTCHRGCAVREITGICVMPTEGVFTTVIRGGVVRCGDEIRILAEPVLQQR